MDIDFDYCLSPKSVVFDVGGYKGDFAEFIRKKYGCGVHTFEPCKEYFGWIVERFKNDPMIWPYNFALEDRDYESALVKRHDSSSLYHCASADAGTTEDVQIRDIFPFIGSFKLTHIDLMKLNCEGSEYPILKRLGDADWLKNVRHLAVQFHPMPGWTKETFESLLSITHTVGHKDNHWQWWKLR